MGFTAKAKSSTENWGMGFLFVFLPEDDTNSPHSGGGGSKFKRATSHPFNSSPSSSPLPPPPLSSPSFRQPITALLRRTNSSHLLSTAQSTISICVLLFFITLLLFTLSTFEPNTSLHHFSSPRRQLSSSPTTNRYSFASKATPIPSSLNREHANSRALQGMGTLYRRGTRAMNELVVAHLVETLTLHELKIFLRLLHRSGLTSRSDLLLLYSSASFNSSLFDNTIHVENDSFLKLIGLYAENSKKNLTESTRKSGFDVSQFFELSKKERESGEPIWGRKIRGNSSSENGTEMTSPSYGSVVAFNVDELDPENSLAGFMDHVPMNLRRWACYPMLLGRVRRNFKLIMLVDAKQVLLLGDPLSRVRNKSPETVYLSTVTQSSSGRHGKKNSEKTQSAQQQHVNPSIILGGARGARRLSSAMLIEIARATMQHKKKNSVTEFGLFNQLVGNENLLKNVKLIKGTELIPELSSLAGSNSKSGSFLSISDLTMVRRGNSNTGVDSTIARHICSFAQDSQAYSDC